MSCHRVSLPAFSFVLLLLVSLALPSMGAFSAVMQQYGASDTTCSGEVTTVKSDRAEDCKAIGTQSYQISCDGASHGSYQVSELNESETCAPGGGDGYEVGADNTDCTHLSTLGIYAKVDCLYVCEADADCSGSTHGTCNTETGVCECTADWTGDSCDTAHEANYAQLKIYDDVGCTDNLEDTVDVKLDTCIAFPDGVHSLTVSCADGVKQSWSSVLWDTEGVSGTEFCSGTAIGMPAGASPNSCTGADGKYITVECLYKKEGAAAAVHASMMIVAALAVLNIAAKRFL